MKTKHVKNILMLSFFVGTLTAMTTGCKSDDSATVEQYDKQYLTVDTTYTKVDYFVGDTFDKTNLAVKLVTEKDGKKTSTKTDDYYLSIDENTPLKFDDDEIIVISNKDGVKSASFKINVKYRPLAKDAIYNAVKNLRDKGNYTVDTKIGTNKIKGIVADNGVVWASNEPAYFYEDIIGYSTYDDLTFSFNFNSGEIKNATFLIDQHSYDFGLFNSETLDMFEYRIPNYSINNMTDEELEYIKNQEIDELNRILITPEHSKWLFNTIGHKLGSYNPEIAFVNGVAYITLDGDGNIVIETIPNEFSNLAGQGSVSVIKDVGTTKIDVLDKFLKNPTFTPSLVDRDLIKLEKLIRDQNYTISSTVDGTSGIFTKEYSTVKGALRDKKNPTSISVREPNDLHIDAGLYRLEETERAYKIHSDFTMSYKSTVYLDSFPVFLDMNDRFVKNDQGIYIFKIDQTDEPEIIGPEAPEGGVTQSGISLMYYDFATAFAGALPEKWEFDEEGHDQKVFDGTKYDRFELKINKTENVITSFEVSVYGDNLDTKGTRLLGTATISNFGKAKDTKLETWISNFLYRKVNGGN